MSTQLLETDPNPTELSPKEQDRRNHEQLLAELEKMGEPPDQALSLDAMLGNPESLYDLWPGHAYKPPRLAEWQRILNDVKEMQDLFNAESLEQKMQAVSRAVDIIQPLVLRLGSDGTYPVEREAILQEFTEDELAQVIFHILHKQGLDVTPKKGAVLTVSGRLIGLRSFVRYADSTATPSTNAEN